MNVLTTISRLLGVLVGLFFLLFITPSALKYPTEAQVGWVSSLSELSLVEHLNFALIPLTGIVLSAPYGQLSNKKLFVILFTLLTIVLASDLIIFSRGVNNSPGPLVILPILFIMYMQIPTVYLIGKNKKLI